MTKSSMLKTGFSAAKALVTLEFRILFNGISTLSSNVPHLRAELHPRWFSLSYLAVKSIYPERQ